MQISTCAGESTSLAPTLFKDQVYLEHNQFRKHQVKTSPWSEASLASLGYWHCLLMRPSSSSLSPFPVYYQQSTQVPHIMFLLFRTFHWQFLLSLLHSPGTYLAHKALQGLAFCSLSSIFHCTLTTLVSLYIKNMWPASTWGSELCIFYAYIFLPQMPYSLWTLSFCYISFNSSTLLLKISVPCQTQDFSTRFPISFCLYHIYCNLIYYIYFTCSFIASLLLLKHELPGGATLFCPLLDSWQWAQYLSHGGVNEYVLKWINGCFHYGQIYGSFWNQGHWVVNVLSKM